MFSIELNWSPPPAEVILLLLARVAAGGRLPPCTACVWLFNALAFRVLREHIIYYPHFMLVSQIITKSIVFTATRETLELLDNRPSRLMQRLFAFERIILLLGIFVRTYCGRFSECCERTYPGLCCTINMFNIFCYIFMMVFKQLRW